MVLGRRYNIRRRIIIVRYDDEWLNLEVAAPYNNTIKPLFY